MSSNKNTIDFLHNHELSILSIEQEKICSICNIEIYSNSTIYSCEQCSLIICPQCIQIIYLIPKNPIPLQYLKLKNVLSHNNKCKSNFMLILNKSSKCDECNSEDKFLMFCRTCENFNLCLKCFAKTSNDKISFSYFIHEHPMKELNMGTEYVCDICEKKGNYLFSSFQCAKCNFDICEECYDNIISIEQPIKNYNYLQLKNVINFKCEICEKNYKEKKDENGNTINNFMLTDGKCSMCLDCFYNNKTIKYEIVNYRKIYNKLFFDSGNLLKENEELKNENQKVKVIITRLIDIIQKEREKKKNNNNNDSDSDNDNDNDKRDSSDKESDNKNNNNKFNDDKKDKNYKNNNNKNGNNNRFNNEKVECINEKKEDVEFTKGKNEEIEKLLKMIKEKENEVKKNKEEMNQKLNKLYNSKDQSEKKMNEEMNLLRAKINNNNKNNNNNNANGNPVIIEDNSNFMELKNQIDEKNLKIEELNKLIIEKQKTIEQSEKLMAEKEKSFHSLNKNYNEVNQNYIKLIKKHKDEKNKVEQLIKHFDIKKDVQNEIFKFTKI